MKYTWYMFKMEKQIESCHKCPIMDKLYNCKINPYSYDYDDLQEKIANCPLIKIEGRVEE